eukprot:scaffold19825_cov103-Isochrysis_galbana.AAC.1
MEDDLDLRTLVDELGSEAFGAGGALAYVAMGTSSGALHMEEEDGELSPTTRNDLQSAMAALAEEGDPSFERALLGRGASNAELDAAAGARSSADFLRVAREAGLVGFCDALAFCGLAEEMPELCAAGITVLAPTDAAFAQLARRTRCSKRLVRHILLAHLSAGVSMLRDLHSRRCAAALGGQTHAAVLEGGCTYVGTARVSRADIPFDGGVIHQ